MTIPYCIQIGDHAQSKTIEAIILKTFQEVHQIYNNWNPDSEISRLNTLPAHHPISLSPQLAAFLQIADQLVAHTEGRFDPTMGPLSTLWKEALKQGKIPPSDEHKMFCEAAGWDKIHFENGIFWKEHSLTALDTGGIAKGYAVDLLAKRLEEAGYLNFYVEWGGEIRVKGHHPNNRPWEIGIYGLSSTPLIDQAIATSGSYLQSWTIEDTQYTHIIDPATHLPLHSSPISSATVLAPTCTEADALATALMLFPSLESAHLWAQSHSLQVFLW
jgi:thiamine biosynthesis lipoprotein